MHDDLFGIPFVGNMLPKLLNAWIHPPVSVTDSVPPESITRYSGTRNLIVKRKFLSNRVTMQMENDECRLSELEGIYWWCVVRVPRL
jgi:hypothetical protein